jgi:hypothetical protein
VVVFIFLAVLRVEPGSGLQLASKKLGEAFLSAWALSQLTKVPRALGYAHFSGRMHCNVNQLAQLHSCRILVAFCLEQRLSVLAYSSLQIVRSEYGHPASAHDHKTRRISVSCNACQCMWQHWRRLLQGHCSRVSGEHVHAVACEEDVATGQKAGDNFLAPRCIV